MRVRTLTLTLTRTRTLTLTLTLTLTAAKAEAVACDEACRHSTNPNPNPNPNPNLNPNHDPDEACRQRIADRRAIFEQSRTTTSRQNMMDLSRQRAALYNTTYQGASCIPGIPCL